MTITEFLTELERVCREPCRGCLGDEGARFRLNGDFIESDEEYCPISEVAWRQDDEITEIDVFARGGKLGLRSRDIRAIINAADGKTNGRLRQKLLVACGIQPRKIP